MKGKEKNVDLQSAEGASVKDFHSEYNILSNANVEHILFESIDNPIWIVDREGKLVSYNKAFVKIFKFRFKIEPEKGLYMLNLPLYNTFNLWKELYNTALNGTNNSSEFKLKEDSLTSFYHVEASPISIKGNIEGVIFVSTNITSRKTAENVLFKSKAHLHALLDNIPYLVWLKDVNGKLVIVNNTFVRFFKIEVTDFCADNPKMLPEYQEFWEYLCSESDILSSGAKQTEEKTITINGETFWFEIHKTPIFDDSSLFIGTSGMARDITSRKAIENILLDSEERFRQFAENTSDAFILCSPDSVLYVNPAFEKIYGHNIQEAYQNLHIPEKWIHADDRAKVSSHFRSDEYKNTGKFNGQFRVIRADGSITWVWERSFPIYNEQNEVIRFISVASDITRQKQLEFDLLKTQTQQQAILDNIPHMAWLKDVEGKYVSVNEAFAQHYGHKKDEMVGKSDSDFCHPDIAELYAYNDYIVLKTKKQQQFDEFNETKDGIVYSETIKTPVINSETEVIGITGISRDITYYKRLEQQLRSNDDRLKALLRNSTDSITLIDAYGKIIFDSSLFNKICNISGSDAIGRLFTDVISNADKTLVLSTISQTIETPDNQHKAEFCCKSANGELLYFESFFSNQLTNSLINGIVVNSRDITERKLAEIREKEYQENLVFLENTALEFLSLSSSEQIYNYIGKKLFELVPESVIIFSTYDDCMDSLIIQNITGVDKFLGVIIEFLGRSPLHYCNKLTEQTKRELRFSSNKLHSLNGGIYNVCNHTIDYVVCKALEKLITMNKAYGMGIVRSGKLLGSIVILTRFEHVVKDPRIVETFIYQASIALQRRRLEKELIAAKDKAEESDRLKTAFLANMSHEIRTPVNGIIGFSQLLETTDLPDEKRIEFVEIIKANANSLIGLIDDILDVSIIQEGQVKLRKTTVNINLLLDEVFSTFLAPRYQEQGLGLEIIKSLPDEHAIINADPLRLKQVLNNLLSNAFKFTEKGKIEFGYHSVPGFIRFYVKDSGIGISKDSREAIFQRFNQADISFTRKFGGSGLGLTISKGLVELMGGDITLDSEVGVGSTFYFTIPGSEFTWDNTINDPAHNGNTFMN
jgi:PAS domain S-box-containing protein